MSWWESTSGTAFRSSLLTVAKDYHEALTWIFAKTGINPSVIDKWKKGGNPSLVNLRKIYEALNFDKETIEKLINEVRNYKRPKETPKVQGSMRIFKAIINEYDPKTNKYWVRVFSDTNKFITGDRITKYGYVYKFINTPLLRERVVKVIKDNNFMIEFDAKVSIPENK
jgi:transcriptional regulator with XRE-family HTH domain